MISVSSTQLYKAKKVGIADQQEAGKQGWGTTVQHTTPPYIYLSANKDNYVGGVAYQTRLSHGSTMGY